MALLAGCGKANGKLDPDNPVTVTAWHYYNGAQQTAFDALVKEFNDTVGLEKGHFCEKRQQGRREPAGRGGDVRAEEGSGQ